MLSVAVRIVNHITKRCNQSRYTFIMKMYTLSFCERGGRKTHASCQLTWRSLLLENAIRISYPLTRVTIDIIRRRESRVITKTVVTGDQVWP